MQLGGENGAVPLLMRLEFAQLGQQRRRGEARGQNLRAVDVHRALLARMVDLEDAAAERGVARGHGAIAFSASSTGTVSPTFTRLMATSVLKRFTLLFSKNSSRVSRVYSAMLRTAKISTKSHSPAT